MKHSVKKQLEKNSNWPEVKEILQKILQEGFQALIVGGAVRDALLNREVKEMDLASSAKPKDLLKLFPQAIDAFKKYGVVFIPLKDRARLEIVSFRKDSLKTDGRRPEFIEYGVLETDFMRRDFTINALYYDLQKDQIFDFAKGQKHLREKKIKTIGKAKDRFKEDYLRMLRALRFESQLDFKLDPEIKPAIEELKQNIKKISSERITEEIQKVFSTGKTLSFIKSLKKHDLFDLIFPDLDFNKLKTYFHFFEPESFDLKKEDLQYRILLSWLTLGLAGFYGNKKSFQSFLKNYALSSSIKKEILNYFNSVEILLKERASQEEKWIALDGKADIIYQLSRALLLQSKLYPLSQRSYKEKKQEMKEEKVGRAVSERRVIKKELDIKITEKQLLSLLKEFQKRAKKGKLPSALLKGSDLLNKKPVIKKEDFSKVLKKAYHLQLSYPQLTKQELLKKVHPLIKSN